MVVEVCENPFVLKILLFVEQIIKIAYLLVPIGLVVFITIDFVKGIISGEEKSKGQFMFSVKRIINVIALFLVPTFISFVMNFLNDVDIFHGDYAACLKNTSNVSYYEDKYAALELQEEEKKKTEQQKQLEEYEYNKELAKRKKLDVKTKAKTDSSGDVHVGTTYNLSDSDIKKIAAVYITEKGHNPGPVAAEATMSANKYEDSYSSKYSSIVSWVCTSGYYQKDYMCNNTSAVTDELFNAVKDVLVNGNRTLPLYIDSHDCLWCFTKAKYRCPNGNPGDICYLDNDGKILSSESELKDRQNSYIRDKTKVYTRYKLKNSTPSEKYFIFYTFVSDNSGPVGYTERSYKRING